MRSLRLLLVVLCAAALLPAQVVSSTVKGTVHDQSGAAVPNAQCTLTNTGTGVKVIVESGTAGDFVFLDVLNGTYSLSISAPGFKTFDLSNIVVTSSEFHPLSDIVLTVGQNTESVTVSEKAPPVQTSSGERSGTITGTQLSDVAVRGRDFLSYMDTLPGIVDTSALTRDAPGRNATGGLQINGSRATEVIMMIDGAPSEDAGNNANPEESTMDSIAEVKVLTDAYQAEYGRNGGGTISVITKSGGEQFHGSAYEYYRDEELDANTFFNNETGTQRQPYRYRITGWSLGGPLYIPKVLPQLRHKLFFFFGTELNGSKVLYPQQLVNTPTALERAGNFSQSFNTNGSLITITDPTTGKAFPGNVIPASEINSTGQAVLNFYPTPNYVDPRPGFLYSDNLKSNFSGSWPRNQEIGRVDYNLGSKTQIYFRIMNDTSPEQLPYSASGWPAGSINYNLTPIIWNRPSHMYTAHVTETLSPTLVDEFSASKTYNQVYIYPQEQAPIQRSAMGNIPLLFPESNPTASWIPAVSFGGTPTNTINGSLQSNLSENLSNDAEIFINNLSKVWGKHQIKTGFYVERNRKLQPATENFRGSFSFAVDANNPNNTGNGFANALLGNFDTYTQATNWPIGNFFFWNVEAFIQDNWHVTSRLTLDYGIRFSHDPPQFDRDHTTAGFDPALYTAAQAPVLYRPAFNAAGQKAAQNPLTGAFYPASYVGLFVPGVGNPANGMVVGGENGVASGLITQPYLAFDPRFGFAYDVFGNGRTAIRGGFGMFMDRVQGNEIYNTSGLPPVTYSPTLYYGNLSTFTQGTGLLGPSSISEWYGPQKYPEIMNFNLGIQHQFGSWLADVAYVGMLSRHLVWDYNINAIPFGAQFAAANQNPTSPGTPLSNSFLVPYTGFTTINQQQYSATANYNSLQVSIKRRLANGLQLSAAYTLSKGLGVTSSDSASISSYLPARAYNYGPLSYDRRQSLVISYVYLIPNVGKRTAFKPAGWVLDNWELSGISTFQTGAPLQPSFSTNPSVNICGCSDTPRPEIVGNPNLSSRSILHEFNTAAFAEAPIGTLGNEGVNPFYGPGINNWDLSVTKRFPLRSESRSLSFRGEFYNVWNHPSFSSVNTSFTFNAAGQNINAATGQATATFPARTIEISGRITF